MILYPRSPNGGLLFISFPLQRLNKYAKVDPYIKSQGCEYMERETFGSRLGFILISAGCAIGLGNVWRFPYIVGEYGGAAFILIYLLFLVLLGIPIMTMEFSVGRASRKSVASSFRDLEPKGTKWHIFGYFGMAGNYLLMMFYTTVSGWMLAYLVKMAKGDFVNLSGDAIKQEFDSLTADPWMMLLFMGIIVLVGFGICSLGLKNGVERITKVMMTLLIVIMIVLAVRSITLPNAGEGLSYYLVPNFEKMLEKGIPNVLFAALSQAFFTLSIGMGSMAIFGSYLKKDRKLLGETVGITVLDTFVAFVAGLIIIPACFAYNVDPQSGPPLIFVTLPHVFNEMPMGRLWGSLFFLFMVFAAISTVIAVFENILSFAMDLWGWSRKKACLVNIIAVFLLSIPCLLGFNVLSGFHPLGGTSTILDFEDFLVSQNILPLGSLVYVLFCCTKHGWTWDNFIKEANTGAGMNFPRKIHFYAKYIIPVIIIYILVQGYIGMFFS